MDNYLNEYPDDAKSWADATDELKDIAKTAREFIGEYDDKQIKPLDFKSFKTPSEWNTKAKKYIKDTYESMSDNCKKEFENELKDRFKIEFSEAQYTFQKNMKESRFRKRNSLKEAKSLPMNLVKQYERRAEAERDAGTEVDINENIPYIAVDFANGQNYYFQGHEAEELLNEVPDNLDPEDYILAISQNW